MWNEAEASGLKEVTLFTDGSHLGGAGPRGRACSL